MAKVTRRRLSRGHKFEVSATNTEGHVFPELEDMAGEFTGGRISRDQMETPDGIFHVFLHMPWLDADYIYPQVGTAPVGSGPGTEDSNYGIPFILPPLREDFSYTTDDDGQKSMVLDEGVPIPILESISFGFDTRSEPALIAGRYYGGTPPAVGTAAGGLDYQFPPEFEIRLSLVSRQPRYFVDSYTNTQPSPDDLRPTGEVWSATLTSEAFSAYGLRDNPILFKDINRAIDPSLTYVWVIRAEGLLDLVGNLQYALVSVTADLRFRIELQSPVQDLSSAQNRPTIVQASPSVTITAPGIGPPNPPILADGAAGIQTGIDNIDDVFAAKLGGGFGRHGEGSLDRVLSDYGCYDVIAVPLFNARLNGGIDANDVATEPYSGAATDPLFDRRRVVLTHPFVLHRAILAWNWQLWTADATQPTAIPTKATFQVDVGVGIGAGLRSDSGIVYDNVASHTMTNPRTPATWETRLIDKIAIKRTLPTRTGTNWDLELHELRIVGTTVAGVSFQDQGERVYMGQTWTPLGARENIGTAAAPYTPGAPNCAGAEQFIEVRMKIQDSAATIAGEVVSGYGGHWVYLIGRKYLTR
jgi:hypothetical protein